MTATPDDADLANQKNRAADLAEIAASEQKAAEARKATMEAERSIEAAETTAREAAAKAKAQNDQALAEAQKAAAEARKAADAAKREMRDADAAAQRASEKADAENRKAIAEADVGAVKAFLPGPAQLKPLEGTVTSDDKSGILGEAVAYTLLAKATHALANDMKGKLKGRTVLVLNGIDLAASDWNHALITRRTTALAKAVTAALKLPSLTQAQPPTVNETTADGRRDSDHSTETTETEPLTSVRKAAPTPEHLASLTAGPAASAVIGAIGSTLPAIVGAAADVAGYFQSNFDIKGRTVTLTTNAVTSALASELADVTARDQTRVIADTFRILPDTGVVAALEELLELRQELAASTAAATFRTTTADARLAALQAVAAKADNEKDRATEAAAVTAAQLDADALHATVAFATAVLTDVDQYVVAITTVPATGGSAPLATAALRDLLHRKPPPSIARDHADKQQIHRPDGVESKEQRNENTNPPQPERRENRSPLVLTVAVPSFAAETQTRQRRFFSPSIRYVGTCTISALLAETDGEIIGGGNTTLTGYVQTKLTKFDKPTLKTWTVT